MPRFDAYDLALQAASAKVAVQRLQELRLPVDVPVAGAARPSPAGQGAGCKGCKSFPRRQGPGCKACKTFPDRSRSRLQALQLVPCGPTAELRLAARQDRPSR
jgi:hypothetical protein